MRASALLLRTPPVRRYDPGMLAAYLTRASAAWGFDPATGLLTQYASNVARLVLSPVGVMSVLREPQSTNLMLRCSEFDNAAWTKSGAPTIDPDAATAPDGTLTADRITFTTGSAGSQVWQVVGSTAGPVTNSIYLRADSPVAIQFGQYNDGITNALCNVTTTWQRFEVPAAAMTGADRRACWMYHASATPGVQVYAWGAQFEQQAGATSHIPTAGSTVTRSRDEIVIPTVVGAGAPNTYVADVCLPWFHPSASVIFGRSAGDNATLNFNAAQDFNNATGLTYATTVAVNTRHRLALAANASGRAMALNGVVSSDAATEPATTNVRLGQLQGGSDTQAGPVYIHEYRQARRRLSHGELQWHTTA